MRIIVLFMAVIITAIPAFAVTNVYVSILPQKTFVEK